MLLAWLPWLGLLVVYDELRAAVSVAPGGRVRAAQIAVDKVVGAGAVPTVWLQQHLWSAGRLHWYDYAVWAVYMTHFFVVWLVAAMLWRADRARFARYALVTVVLTLSAFLVYWLFPAQPPWLAAEAGRIGPVERIVPRVWDHLGLTSVTSVYDNGDLVNTVAAMPSLHAAYPMMLLLFFWAAGRRVRIGLGAVHARDGLRARLQRRALRHRHPRGLGVGGAGVGRGRGGVPGGRSPACGAALRAPMRSAPSRRERSMTTAAGERLIQCDGVDLCVEAFGDPGDDAILLIHGASASMLWWEEALCARIAAGGRYVIRFDNRDTGRSSAWPPGRPGYGIGDMAGDAIGILDALGVTRAHVVGRSMAGAIAPLVAARDPGRVASLTLVSTTPGDPGLSPMADAVVRSTAGAGPDPADPASVVAFIVGLMRVYAGGSPHFDEAATRALAERDVARTANVASCLTEPLPHRVRRRGRAGRRPGADARRARRPRPVFGLDHGARAAAGDPRRGPAGPRGHGPRRAAARVGPLRRGPARTHRGVVALVSPSRRRPSARGRAATRRPSRPTAPASRRAATATRPPRPSGRWAAPSA